MLVIIGEDLHPAPRRFASALRGKMIFLSQFMLQATNEGVLRTQFHCLPRALDLLDSPLRLFQRLSYGIRALLDPIDIGQALLHLGDFIAPDDIDRNTSELCVSQ